MEVTTTNLTLAQLAELVSGTIRGNPQLVIHGAADIRNSLPGYITLADKPELEKRLAESEAAAVVITDQVKTDKPAIVVENVAAAFTKIVAIFRPVRDFANQNISQQAVIDPTATLGAQVTVHALAHIGKCVSIGDRCVIHPGVIIMDGCVIGADTEIFPNVVLYHDTVIGQRCLIHGGAILGAYGFGYDSSSGKHQRCAQFGNVLVEDDVEIGAKTTIDRGTYSSTRIRTGTKIDNQVMIGHNCDIGPHNLICSQVGVAGSCSTGNYVVMGGQVGLRDHLHIGDEVILGAKTGVMNDITEKGIHFGIPSSPLRDSLLQLAALRKLPGLMKEFNALKRQITALQTALSPVDTTTSHNSNSESGTDSTLNEKSRSGKAKTSAA
jgi:UDP-3-O-[3-hydroxymyristoyl] glucosamine N-acyltransferase